MGDPRKCLGQPGRFQRTRNQHPTNPPPCPAENAKKQDLTPYDEDEINLLDYWRVIWKRRKLIGYIVAVTVVLTAVVSLFMTNIYQAKAIVTPVAGRDGTGAASVTAMMAQQFGIIQQGPAPGVEIMNLMKANIVREKMISRYNLLPILFPKKWDKQRQTWKQGLGGTGFSLNPLSWISALAGAISGAVQEKPAALKKKQPGVPDTWDGLRQLQTIINVTQNLKENTITITVDFRDPELAVYITNCLLTSLVDHITDEAKRVAKINKEYLENQLAVNSDPFIKQKIYGLIAAQIETVTMAEIKENFAFKVIDPPRVPDKKIKPKQMVMLSLSWRCLSVFCRFLPGVSGKGQNTKETT